MRSSLSQCPLAVPWAAEMCAACIVRVGTLLVFLINWVKEVHENKQSYCCLLF